MRRIVPALAALVLASQALAQGVPPGGGGQPPGGGGGSGRGGGRGDGPPGGQQRPREAKPVKRSELDEAVTAMFRSADSNRDGMVTLEEVRAIFQARRDAIIRERFTRIDSDGSGAIEQAEFLAWQGRMGTVASVEGAGAPGRDGPVEEALRPELGDDMEDRMLARLIEPLSATTLVAANTNYDGGVSLEEWLAYQRKRFDGADADSDGKLTMDEMRSLMPESGRPEGPGAGPGAGQGGRGGRARPPGCPSGENC